MAFFRQKPTAERQNADFRNGSLQFDAKADIITVSGKPIFGKGTETMWWLLLLLLFPVMVLAELLKITK